MNPSDLPSKSEPAGPRRRPGLALAAALLALTAAARATGAEPAPAQVAPSQAVSAAQGAPGSQATVTVCPTCAVKKLADAVKLAGAGATIVIRSGLYSESDVVIDKPVSLVGQDSPVIDGGGKSQIITVKADGVAITGLTLKNSGTSYLADLSALRIEQVGKCRIENNRFYDNFFAIYLAAASDCVVRGNEVKGHAVSEAFSGNGIHAWNSRDILVENNRVSGHRDGLYFEFMHDSVVRGNVSQHNVRYGLHTMYSSDNRYEKNVVRANQAGVVLMYSKKLKVVDNLFEDNWGPACYGALLKDLDDSELTDNTVAHNSVGLYAEDSNRNSSRRNVFYNNGFAIRVMANAEGNVFCDNAFDANTFDATTNSTAASTNVFSRNYWSGYRGYDLNHDGVGDVPYWPVRLFGLLVEEYPTAIILLRSPFAGLMDAAEAAIPLLTPQALVDKQPLIQEPPWSKSKTSANALARYR